MRSWLINSALRHPLSAPVLLVAVILAVYYPVLFSGINPIDDPGIFAASKSSSLSSMLLPGRGYYYRPIVELSFYIDNWLWGMEPVTMHLENILLHCVNSLLVYFLARKILFSYDNASSTIPLVVALLFALHPVNVEAVAWIAGRTDPLLTSFILSSCYFWVGWIDKPTWRNIAASLLLFVAALLTKESALGFGAVALLLALFWPGTATKKQRLMAVVILVLFCVALIIFSLLFRSSTSGLNLFISGSDFQLLQVMWSALIALGFYIKKMFFPLPLNFAITTVHPIYGFLGVVIFPALLLVFRRSRLSGVLLLSAVLLILPAILIAVKQIAWTPFAERYLYLSTAFLVLSLAGICANLQKCSAALKSAYIIVICVFLLACFQRSLLWNDTQAFFEDAVAKSPEFGSVYYSLGGVLIQKGLIDRAAEAFDAADRLNSRVSMRYPIKAGIMGTMLAKGEFLEVRTYFYRLFNKKEAAPADFLELLYQADSKRLLQLEKNDKMFLAHDLIDTLGLLYKRNSDPYWLYRSGQMSLIMGDNLGAEEYFRQSYLLAPLDSHYRLAAQTYFHRLEQAK